MLLALGLLAALERPALADDPFMRSGTLSVAVADDFTHQKAEFLYELRTDDGETLSLLFAHPPEGLRTGDRIAVHGRARLRAFDVDEVEPLVEPSGFPRAPLGREALSAWTVGAKRVLVILLNFTDDASLNGTTVTNAQNLFFGAGSSVARYYNEASYGLATMTGDVVLVTATVAKPTTCATGTIQSQANARALAAGYNPASYNFPVWIFPGIGACAWNGLGYVGGAGSWINGTGSMSLLVGAHELGHNFGLSHAHSYACTGAAIAPTGCSRSDYGDRFDVMGNSRAGHFNAYSKETFGWLPAGSVRNHAGGSATYTIGPLEGPGQAAYAVRIPTTMSARTYWIEWRDRSGFDSVEPAGVVNGGLIRFAPSAVGGTDLLDMHVSTPGNFDDAELDVGSTFTDPELSLTITAISKTATSLTVQVDYGAPPPASSFHVLTPCRIIDTRNPNGTYGGPALFAGQVRSFVIRGQCGVPGAAKSIAGNLTVASPTAAGAIRLVPGGAPATGTSTVNFRAGRTRANNVAMGLGASGDVVVDGLPSGTAHVILDAVGWFE
ncbi:MAG: reprolysin-like metallopeptidase [Acidobacteriota bacterium]